MVFEIFIPLAFLGSGGGGKPGLCFAKEGLELFGVSPGDVEAGAGWEQEGLFRMPARMLATLDGPERLSEACDMALARALSLGPGAARMAKEATHLEQIVFWSACWRRAPTWSSGFIYDMGELGRTKRWRLEQARALLEKEALAVGASSGAAGRAGRI